MSLDKPEQTNHDEEILRLRPMNGTTDLNTLAHLFEREGWNYNRLLLGADCAVFPFCSGFVLCNAKDDVFGGGFLIIRMQKRVANVASVVVAQRLRNRGWAKKIMLALLDTAHSEGLKTLRLLTALGMSLYSRFGFDEINNLRLFQRKPRSIVESPIRLNKPLPGSISTITSEAIPDHLAEITHIVDCSNGIDGGATIAAILRDTRLSASIYTIRSHAGSLSAFCIVIPYAKYTTIGPLWAHTISEAEELVQASIRDQSDDIELKVLLDANLNQTVAESVSLTVLLTKFGFTYVDYTIWELSLEPESERDTQRSKREEHGLRRWLFMETSFF